MITIQLILHYVLQYKDLNKLKLLNKSFYFLSGRLNFIEAIIAPTLIRASKTSLSTLAILLLAS